MSYLIKLSYEDEFVELMETLKTKYGEQLFNLDGIGEQLDMNHFSKGFFTSDAVSNVSVDPNANVDDTSVIAFTSEYGKPLARLDSYYMLWKYLVRIFSAEDAEEILEAQLRGDIYIHDFHGIACKEPYCFNFATYDVMMNGLPMVKKITSYAPNHLLAFRSQLEQFVVLAANSTLGATGLADMLISCSYYMQNILRTKSDAHFRFNSEEDCFEYFKQTLISFIYTMNQPLRANQSPFTNISLFDRPFLESVTREIIFPDGSRPNLDLIEKLQDIFIDAMNEELRRTPITFPVTTACISIDDTNTPKDMKFLRKVVEKNLEWGFINFYAGNTATLSSCCRLRSSTENEFFNSFGAGSSKIGSLGVVTINFPRLAFTSKDEQDFEARLRHYIQITGKINEAKREIMRKGMDGGHMPLYTMGFMDLNKQYSTTGVNGLYECLSILGYNILDADGQVYAERIMKILNEEVDIMQKLYKAPHNCEQVPGETASIKLCKKDKYLHLDMGLDLYSNQFIPLTLNTDVLNRIAIQGHLDKYFSGGSILHINIEEQLTDVEEELNLILYGIKKGVVYQAICYLLNKCKNDHMTVGHSDKCPICGAEIIGKYQRVVGFLTQVNFWHPIRREEDFPNREFYHKGSLKVD